MWIETIQKLLLSLKFSSWQYVVFSGYYTEVLCDFKSSKNLSLELK